MYLAVDVGGTKTLLASYDETQARFTQEVRFPTPDTYEQFLEDFKLNLQKLTEVNFSAAGVAIPGDIDREHGIGLRYGNLAWANNPIQDDLSKLLGCPVYVENDAKAGGLSEALLIKDDFKNVMYITLGTGIGIAYIANGVIDVNYGDRGGTEVFVEHEGQAHVMWESIVSGHAIKARYGKKATDITDEATWKVIAHDLSLGLSQLIAEKHPEVVVFGGGAGRHFERYGKLLKAELAPMVDQVPPILPAKHPDEAVIYGCVDLIKQHHGKPA
jgi:predicted NBD/HSP70 family sugar kinase